MLLKQGPCISCGQCTVVCPTKALAETPSKARVLQALVAGKHLVAVVDPSVLVGLGDAFDQKRLGRDATGKVVGALRGIGFKTVIDLRGAIDLATAEIAEEMLERLERKKHLPFVLSTCPAVVNMVEKSVPGMIKCLSTVKTPQQILGNVLKGPWAMTKKLKADNVFVVLVTACIAGKDEAKRMQLSGSVDATLTVREVAEMVKEFGLDWGMIKPKEFDSQFRSSSQTSSLVSLSGGWTQAVLKYLAAKNGQFDGKDFQFKTVAKGTMEGEFTIGKWKIKAVICDGSSAGHQMFASDDHEKYQMVELMACPGGCAFGGGQPKLPSRSMAMKRIDSLNTIAKACPEQTAVKIMSTFDILSNKLSKDQLLKLRKQFRTHFERQEYAQSAHKRRIASLPIVAYGSTNGRATRYARLVASFVHTSSQSMNNVTIDEILLRKTVILICASYGQGNFPANASRFAKLLEKSKADLSDVSFCVLALGRQSAGANYCAAGVKLFDLMKAKGAKPLLPLTKVDSEAQDGGDNTCYLG